MNLLHQKAAVFERGARKFRDVTVRVGDGKVVVYNAVTDSPMMTYVIDETAKQDMAWDVIVPGERDEPFRLVVQAGCGCGGQKPYEVDPTYSGKVKF